MDSNKKIERLKADVPGVFAPAGQWVDADDKVQFIELMNFEYRANIVALLMRLSKDSDVCPNFALSDDFRNFIFGSKKTASVRIDSEERPFFVFLRFA